MFGIDFDIEKVVKAKRNPLKTAMENKNMIKRINPLQAAMRKKQETEAAKATVEANKEVAEEVINSDSGTLELQKHRYCGLRPGTKMPDCKWTTQSVGWDAAKTKSDLAIIIPDDYVVVDIDDEQEGKALLKLVEANAKEYDTVISCVMRTDHGYHFWFRKPQDVTLEAIGIKHTSKIKTLLTISVDYRVGGKGYMVIRRDGKDRQWVHGSWADLTNVAIVPNILYPIAPTDDRHKPLYQAKAAKYGYQVLPDGRLGSYIGLPKGQRTMALLSYYGYLKTMYTDILPRDINDCKMVIYNINKYLLEEPIPDDELFCEVLNNTERVAVTSDNSDNSGNNTTREQDNDNNGGRDIITLNLHGQSTTTTPKEAKSSPETANNNTFIKAKTAVNKPHTTTNSNVKPDYQTIAREIIDTYNIIYYSHNFYALKDGVYEALNNDCDNSILIIEQMISLSYPGLSHKSEREIVRKIQSQSLVTQSDDHGNLLALNNGVYDVNTHTFSPWDNVADGKYHFFSRIPITYNTLIPVDQTIIDFERYRSSLFDAAVAEDYKKVLDQILGYVFYRQLPAQKIFFFHGPGGTGKSTYANFLSRLVGSSNSRHKTLNMLLDGKFAVSDLKNVMLNIGDEIITTKSLTSVDLLKSLAVDGYREVEAKYKASEKIRLYAKNIFCSNDRPQTQDKAFWDRVIVVPFTNVFRNTDSNIPDEKLKEMMDSDIVKSYMFNLAMSGLKELQENNWNFYSIPEMEEAKKEFIPVANPIEAWLLEAGINEETIVGCSTQDVRESYKQWCITNRYAPMGVQKFTQYLKDIFCVTVSRRRKDGRTVNYFKAENIEEE